MHTDQLVRRGAVFPLGSPGGVVPVSSEPPSGKQTRPFGLRYAVVPPACAVSVQPVVRYDPSRQIALVGDVPLCRHTDGQTNSVTRPDGHGTSNDSDTDHRED